MENLVRRFIEFLEGLNNRGEPTLNLISENDKVVSFQGDIPKKELEKFLNQIYEDGKRR